GRNRRRRLLLAAATASRATTRLLLGLRRFCAVGGRRFDERLDRPFGRRLGLSELGIRHVDLGRDGCRCRAVARRRRRRRLLAPTPAPRAAPCLLLRLGRLLGPGLHILLENVDLLDECFRHLGLFRRRTPGRLLSLALG